MVSRRFASVLLMVVGVVALLLALAFVARNLTPEDTVESLAADPERLRWVLRECRLDTSGATAQQCQTASDAWRQRFFRTGASVLDYVPPITSEDAARPPPSTPQQGQREQQP